MKKSNAIIDFIYDGFAAHAQLYTAIIQSNLAEFIELYKQNNFTDVDLQMAMQILHTNSFMQDFSEFWQINPNSTKQVLTESKPGKLTLIDKESFIAFEALKDAFHQEFMPLFDVQYHENNLMLAAAQCSHPGFIRILAVDFTKKIQGVKPPYKTLDQAMEVVILQDKQSHFELLLPCCSLQSFWGWAIWGTDILTTPKTTLIKRVLDQPAWVDINELTTEGSALHLLQSMTDLKQQGIADRLGILLSRGIDVSLTNQQGQTALNMPNRFGQYLMEVALSELRNAHFQPAYTLSHFIQDVHATKNTDLIEMLKNDGKPAEQCADLPTNLPTLI